MKAHFVGWTHVEVMKLQIRAQPCEAEVSEYVSSRAIFGEGISLSGAQNPRVRTFG